MNPVILLNSPWASKINWTQAVGAIAMSATMLGYTVPTELVPAIATAIGAVTAVMTIVFRTWLTGTPTDASAA